eukprot:9857176-Lingulodinium_polyedra.AAC.1
MTTPALAQHPACRAFTSSVPARKRAPILCFVHVVYCSLVNNVPSAGSMRDTHWWSVPGPRSSRNRRRSPTAPCCVSCFVNVRSCVLSKRR